VRLIVDSGVPVPVRDGTELAADVYLPDGRAPVPALVHRVPYGRDIPRIANFALALPKAVERGYAVVVQDVRGRGGSGGAFAPFLHEETDGADTVRWTAEQPWCDGRVGMIGGSYAGMAQWAAARERPPALRAIAPFVATPDCYDGWIYRSGLFELGFNLHWSLRNIAPAEAARAGQLEAMLAANDAMDALYRRLPLLDQPLLERLTPFYREWLREPVANGRWGRLARDADGAVGVPVLSIGGWYDIFNRGSLRGHELLDRQLEPVPHRLVMGPWAHGVFGGMFAERSFGIAGDSGVVDLTALQLRWLDRWVKDERNGAEHDAAVRLFVMGADYWRDERAWPPPDADRVAFHLRGPAAGGTGGGLSPEPPGDEPERTYRYDPADPVPTVGGPTFLPGLAVAANCGPRDQRAVLARSDVLCYAGAELTEPVEVLGAPRLVLFASSSASDTDFVVTLLDIAPGGRAVNVTDGALRTRYRESRSGGAPLVPWKPTQLAIELDGTAHVFRPGHRIGLMVTSGSFPRFDRNPQTGGDIAESDRLAPAINRVYHDAGRPSRLLLPLVEREQTRERLREIGERKGATR
jgi:uncharacterized protein